MLRCKNSIIMEKISEQKKKLIRRFHIALNHGGMMKQKPAILQSFGVESTKELADAELQQVIDSVTGEGDKWRKRVIAAIFGYCRTANLDYTIHGVKAIACRATGFPDFNRIPTSRLRDLYFEFVRKNKTSSGVAGFKDEVKNYLETCN